MIASSVTRYLTIGFGLVFICFVFNCSGPEICTGLIGTDTVDPKGAACKLHCECNNQYYFGRCVKTRCVSFERSPCITKGQEQPCRIPKEFGEKCLDGVQICQPEGLAGLLWGDCQPKAKFEKEDNPEVCFDKIDNDCNGKLDEKEPACAKFCRPGSSRSCFSGTDKTREIGVCRAGTQACGKDGKWAKACTGEKLPAPNELCNGKDDDCNGHIDDNVKAPPCPKTTGPCSKAVKECRGGSGWAPCQTSTYQDHFPSYEVKETQCDGLDNDCDGKVDNNLPSVPCERTSGQCRGAKRRCGGKSGWLHCTTADYQKTYKGFESTETKCDGLDNDCNGKIDDILNPPPCDRQKGICIGKKKTCGGQKGWKICNNVDFGVNFQQKEDKCDGIDNDCDGVTDENCKCKPSAQQKCGPCNKGLQICKPNGNWGDCVGSGGSAGTEICDNKDNDCDGIVDEDLHKTCYSGASGTAGKGPCKSGLSTCKAGKWGSCLGEILPGRETCNGKDDDCDGRVDDGVRRYCYTGPAGTEKRSPCKRGYHSCSNGKWPTTCPNQVTPKRETCNGKDDDCDGKVDDGAYCSKGTRCYKGKCIGCPQPPPGPAACWGKCQCGLTCKRTCKHKFNGNCAIWEYKCAAS